MDFIIDQVKKVLVLGPHPDDMEFGCLGTVLKLLEQKVEVHLAVFSMCEKSVPEGLPKDIIKKEMLDVAGNLGMDDSKLHLFNYEVREFPKYRQEILEDMVSLGKIVKPDLVFIPSSTDIHQDHQTIHNEGKRAFKFNMLVGYEMPWNNFNFHADLFIKLPEEKVARKIELINMYKSQKQRVYSENDFLRSLMKIRGTQVKAEYAEAFEVIRLIG
jgi:LmbE family N-acetylglucosaminyl deacetylase